MNKLSFFFGFALSFFFSWLYLKSLHKHVENAIHKFYFGNLTLINDNLYGNQLADELHDKVKILCWIMISPTNHRTRGDHIKNTWGRRCNKLLFMSTQPDPELETVTLKNMTEGCLWTKTKKSF